MGHQNKCDLIMVLNLTLQNSHTLSKSGDSNTLQVVQNFPSQMEKSNTDSEQRTTCSHKKTPLKGRLLTNQHMQVLSCPVGDGKADKEQEHRDLLSFLWWNEGDTTREPTKYTIHRTEKDGDW